MSAWGPRGRLSVAGVCRLRATRLPPRAGLAIACCKVPRLLLQDCNGLTRIRLFKRFDQLLMLLADDLAIAKPENHQVDDRLQSVTHGAKHELENWVFRSFHQQTMEPHVGGAELFVGQRRIAL